MCIHSAVGYRMSVTSRFVGRRVCRCAASPGAGAPVAAGCRCATALPVVGLPVCAAPPEAGAPPPRWLPVPQDHQLHHRPGFGWPDIGAPPSPWRLPPDTGAPPSRLPVSPDHQSGFGWPKLLQVVRPPPLLVQLTLTSLCSTHRYKDNNFCSTLYMVRALFDLSMWNIS